MSNPRSATTPGRAPECALNLPGLDATYRIAATDKDLNERFSLLTVALREHFSERDAKSKAKWMLSRVWLNPPPDAAAMVTWALANPQEFPDRRLMHAGALVATYPFVGGILADLGRQIALNEAITVPDLRHRAEGRWGATSTTREAVGKTITTLRRLGVVEGGGRAPIVPATPLSGSPLAATWLVHAVMLTRQVQALDVHDAVNAPELFWVNDLAPCADYPYLETHTEGPKRRVWATR